MKNNVEAVKKWRKNTKNNLVKAFGEKCVICEYSRCNRSLTFHHLDPTKKGFSIGNAMSNPRTKALLAEECEKCIMVCNNCHGEIHDNLIDLSNYKSTFKRDIFIPIKEKIYCKECGKELTKYQLKYCSRSCAGKGSYRKAPSSSNRIENRDILIALKKVNYVNTKAAKILGISDNAIRKRRIRMGFSPSGIILH